MPEVANVVPYVTPANPARLEWDLGSQILVTYLSESKAITFCSQIYSSLTRQRPTSEKQALYPCYKQNLLHNLLSAPSIRLDGLRSSALH